MLINSEIHTKYLLNVKVESSEIISDSNNQVLLGQVELSSANRSLISHHAVSYTKSTKSQAFLIHMMQ